MTKIEAIIRQHELEDVKDHLSKSGIHSMTILDANDFRKGREGDSGTYRGTSVSQDMVKRFYIFFFVEDDLVGEAVETILGAGFAGKGSDGRIAVTPIADLVRISDGARGASALE